jgi:uncharacterized membrane protein YidH (DUF202 family)
MTRPPELEPFDPGLQPERTKLAWQRTSLALAVGSAVAIRLLTPQAGVVATVAGCAGLLLALVALGGTHFRYRRVDRSLRADATLQSVSAFPLIATTGSALLLGVIAVLWLFSRN